MKSHESLRGKITVRMLLISLIPIVIMGAFAGYSMLNAQEGARNSVSKAQTEMRDNVVSISLANEATAMGRELYVDEANAMIDLSQIASNPVVIGLAVGQNDIETAARFLGAQMQITEHFAELTATDAEGTVLVSTNSEVYPGINVSSQSWWTTTELLAVSVENLKEEQVVKLVYGLRIPNPADPEDMTISLGWLKGVVFLDPSETAQRYADHIEQSEMVILTQGSLLADSSNRARSFEENAPLDSIEQAVIDAVEATDKNLVTASTHLTVDGFVIDDQSGMVAGYYRPSSKDFSGLLPGLWQEIATNNSFPTESLIVIMKQPTDIAFSSLNDLEKFESDLEDSTDFMMIVLGSLLLSAMIAAFIISSYFSRSITMPVSRLKKVAERISHGEQNVKIRVDSRDEIGDLAISFKRMVIARNEAELEVTQHRDHLEEKVEERTRDLQKEVVVRKMAEETIQQQYNEIQVRKEELEASNSELIDTREQLRRYNDLLDAKVKDRTDEVEKLLKHKEEFIAQLAHDLRSPLTPIRGLVPIVKDRQTDSQLREFLEVIEESVGYMCGLVEETLELSTLNSTTVNITFDHVSLKNMIDQYLAQKQSIFAENNIQILNIISEDISVTADALRIRELIDNMVTNAIKFMPGGGALNFDANRYGELVTVSVEDTGIGLTEDQIKRVFDEFYKADESRHDLGSSGLGLSICRRIVEKHGGTIWVESEGLQKGTTFYFSLPTEAALSPELVPVSGT